MKEINLKLGQPWSVIKEKLKETNTELTDADLHFEKGNEAALLSHLARKMNRTEEEIRNWIESVAVSSKAT